MQFKKWITEPVNDFLDNSISWWSYLRVVGWQHLSQFPHSESDKFSVKCDLNQTLNQYW